MNPSDTIIAIADLQERLLAAERHIGELVAWSHQHKNQGEAYGPAPDLVGRTFVDVDGRVETSPVCPACGSLDPKKHPLVHVGGEVMLCRNNWHTPVQDDGTDLDAMLADAPPAPAAPITLDERSAAKTEMICPACNAFPQHDCRRPGGNLEVVPVHDARVYALRGQRAAIAMPKDLGERVKKLELALYGDAETLQRFENAWRQGVTPRPEKPAPGFFDRFEAYRKSVDAALAKYRGFLSPLDPEQSSAPLDGQQIATKAFVDAGLQRLSNALRGELAGSPKAVTDLTERVAPAIRFVDLVTLGMTQASDRYETAAEMILYRLLQMLPSLGMLAEAIVVTLGKKARKRLAKALRLGDELIIDEARWMHDQLLDRLADTES